MGNKFKVGDYIINKDRLVCKVISIKDYGYGLLVAKESSIDKYFSMSDTFTSTFRATSYFKHIGKVERLLLDIK